MFAGKHFLPQPQWQKGTCATISYQLRAQEPFVRTLSRAIFDANAPCRSALQQSAPMASPSSAVYAATCCMGGYGRKIEKRVVAARRDDMLACHNKHISMEASRAVWRNLVLPSRASEEAGSRTAKKADSTGDGVRKKRRKAVAQATVQSFEPPASATPQGSSRSLAPTNGRSPEASPISKQPSQAGTPTSRKPPQQGSNRRYSPTTPKHQTAGSLSGNASNDSQPKAEAPLAGSKREAQKVGGKMGREQALARLEMKLRAREPRASTAPPESSQAKTNGAEKRSVSHDAVPQVRAGRARTASKKSPVVCTNNKFDRRLQENGGEQRLGSRSECFRKGFGFIRTHTVPYEKIVTQRLWYHDSIENMPSDYQLCTLPQAFQRGFGAGQARLARQLLEERRSHEGDVHPHTAKRRS